MAIVLGKLTIIIGAGVVGSVLAKEGGLSGFTNLFSGALKIATRHLHQDKDNSRSSGKSESDTLLSQVNNLRQELQLLASSRSITIVTGSASGSNIYRVTGVVIVVGAVGYGYILWKGWKLSDFMFVTRRNFTDACTMVGKEVDLVSSSVSSTKKDLSSRIHQVDDNVNKCLELTVASKDEASKLHIELSGVHMDIESVHQCVETLEARLNQIDKSQEFTSRGLYYLVNIARKLEQRTNAEDIQHASPSSSRPAIELPQPSPVARTASLPPLALEASSPLSVVGTAKVLRSSTALSASALKDILGVSNTIKPSIPRADTMMAATTEISPGNSSTQEPAASGFLNIGRFGWNPPSVMRILTRSRSTASN